MVFSNTDYRSNSCLFFEVNMRFRFKSEDFLSRYFSTPAGKSVTLNNAAEITNKRLDEYLETCPMVYSFHSDEQWQTFKHLGGKTGREYISEESARLFDIQPIEKKCEHHPFVNNDQKRFGVFINYGPNMTCHKCGVKLKAEFKAVE